MCKGRMFQIILDTEFDLKNNPKCKEKIDKEHTKTIYVNFDDKIEPGITVEKIIPSFINEISTLGILVTNLEKNKKLKNFLKPGDIILYLNGVPCINLANSIDIIKYYYETEGMLKIEIQDKKIETRFCCADIFFKKRINNIN
jgi:PDZ domain-containing secreted protein